VARLDREQTGENAEGTLPNKALVSGDLKKPPLFQVSSPRALGLSPQIQGKCKSTLNLDHDGIWKRAESALKPYGR
jgi:hypothetical protein